jgi:hypothetical protein
MGFSQLPTDTLRHVLQDILDDGDGRSMLPILLTSKHWNVCDQATLSRAYLK